MRPGGRGTHLSRVVLGPGLEPGRQEGARRRCARVQGTVLGLAPEAMPSEDKSSPLGLSFHTCKGVDIPRGLLWLFLPPTPVDSDFSRWVPPYAGPSGPQHTRGASPCLAPGTALTPWCRRNVAGGPSRQSTWGLQGGLAGGSSPLAPPGALARETGRQCLSSNCSETEPACQLAQTEFFFSRNNSRLVVGGWGCRWWAGCLTRPKKWLH